MEIPVACFDGDADGEGFAEYVLGYLDFLTCFYMSHWQARSSVGFGWVGVMHSVGVTLSQSLLFPTNALMRIPVFPEYPLL